MMVMAVALRLHAGSRMIDNPMTLINTVHSPATERDAGMRSLTFSVLLLSSDHELQAKIRRTLQELKLTVAEHVGAIPRAAVKQGFDAVLIEARRSARQDLAEVSKLVEPTRTMILMGSRSVLARSADVLHRMTKGSDHPLAPRQQGVPLEELIESKLREFVTAMCKGDACNLHPMLIAAVERPLIVHVLRETSGNQVQAAHVLGMNRNTLRKKITEFRIPVKALRAPAASAT
jgi:two-component system nitrogen regulation response regulator GlnG